jgi:uncharacterized membrane protein
LYALLLSLPVPNMTYSVHALSVRLVLITTCCLLGISCKKDNNTTACSYSGVIRPIINNKCAIPNCHNAGSTLADFSTYEGLKSGVDNGRIRTNVYDLKIMPPASAIPLTEEEKEQLKCWLDNGAPQN